MKQNILLLGACAIWIQKPSKLVSERKNSSSVCVSVRDAPGPVPIAGDRGGFTGSSDPISTAARRGDGSHCDDAGCERMISTRKPSRSTFISSVNSSGYAAVWE